MRLLGVVSLRSVGGLEEVSQAHVATQRHAGEEGALKHTSISFPSSFGFLYEKMHNEMNSSSLGGEEFF